MIWKFAIVHHLAHKHEVMNDLLRAELIEFMQINKVRAAVIVGFLIT